MIRLEILIKRQNNTFVTINNRNSKSFKIKIDDRSDFSSPSFGIISNTGELSFIDFNEEIKKYSEKHELKNGMDVEIYLEDTSSKTRKKIGDFLTNNWKYDVDSRVASVNLVDELTELQVLKIPSKSFDHFFETNISFEWLYNHLFNLTPSKYNFLAFDKLDNQTKSILSNRKFEYAFWNELSLWNAWNDLCTACFCHLYKDFDGNSVLKYNGGN